jgi:hypothetical protein
VAVTDRLDRRTVSRFPHRLVAVAIAATLGVALAGTVEVTPALAATAPITVTTVSYTEVGEHVFTVPAGVTSIHVVAIGAKGGGGYAPGGVGARVEGDLAVTGGQNLYAAVGGAGAAASPKPNTWSAGGKQGGGSGGYYIDGSVAAAWGTVPLSGAGGGGFSGVFIAPINSGNWPPPLLAGGGGGAGASSAGGAGGTPTGQNAVTSQNGVRAGTGGSSVSGPWGSDGSIGFSYGGGGGGGGYTGGSGGLGGLNNPSYGLAGGGGGGSSVGPAGALFSNTSDPASVTISYRIPFSVRLAPVANSTMTVNVPGSSAAALVIQSPTTNSANEVWTFRPVGNGYEIINRGSGQCLTAPILAGYTLFQWPCADGPTQQWITGSIPGVGGASWVKNAYTGLYMDVHGASTAPGGAIDTWTQNDGYRNQSFLMIPA